MRPLHAGSGRRNALDYMIFQGPHWEHRNTHLCTDVSEIKWVQSCFAGHRVLLALPWCWEPYSLQAFLAGPMARKVRPCYQKKRAKSGEITTVCDHTPALRNAHILLSGEVCAVKTKGLNRWTHQHFTYPSSCLLEMTWLCWCSIFLSVTGTRSLRCSIMPMAAIW